MGCDIHTIAQIYAKTEEWDETTQGSKVKWITVDSNIGGEWRDYDSYSVLADVRNYEGRGELWEHLPLRGLPVGVKEEEPIPPSKPYTHTDTVYTTQWLGDHSYNHATLKELVDFRDGLIGTRKKRGVVDAETYTEYRDEGKLPKSWCGSVWGGRTSTVTPEQADAGDEHTHVQLEWDVVKRDQLGYFDKCIEHLTRIAEKWDVKPSHVRFVFGFDS